MEENENQIQNAKRSVLWNLFICEIKNHNYSGLQRLYEFCQINNNRLAELCKTKRNVGLFGTEQIFIDISTIVIDEILKNKEAEALFRQIYGNLWPDIVTEVENLPKKCQKQNIDYRSFPVWLKESHKSNPRQWFYRYLCYEPEIFNLLGDNVQKLLLLMDKEKEQTSALTELEVLQKADSELVFSDGTPVLSSPMFKKTIERRRKDIADYLGIPEKKLNDYIYECMLTEDPTTSYSDSFSKTSDFSRMLRDMAIWAFANHACGNDWQELLTARTGYYAQNKYKPDIDSIIYSYYRTQVYKQMQQCAIEHRPFLPSTLSRECKASPAEDFKAILVAYEIDLLVKIMSMINEDYYENFSWEKITKNNESQRYGQIIDNLKSTISGLEQTISEMNSKNQETIETQAKLYNSATTITSREKDKLLKEIEKLESENEKSKRTIDSYEDYIKELTIPEDVSNDQDYDLDALKAKRYLFVGNIDDIMPSLKKEFPNSVFMSSETMNLSGVDVDAVVMLIKRMSHAMYYKIKSQNSLSKLPLIRFNGVKQEDLYSKMTKVLHK